MRWVIWMVAWLGVVGMVRGEVGSVESGGKGVETIAFEAGWGVGAGEMVFRVVHVRPGEIAMWIGGEDQTPLVLAAEGKVLVYDVVNDEILLMKGRPFFRWFAVGGDMNLNFGWTPVSKVEAQPHVLLDFASLLRMPGEREAVKDALGKDWLVTRSERGNRLQLRVDGEGGWPVTRAELVQKGMGMTLWVDGVKVNGEVRKELLRFPDEAELRKLGRVVEVDEQALLRRMRRLIQGVTGNLLVRVAIMDETQRATAEEVVGRKLDWEQLKQSDQVVGIGLRGLTLQWHGKAGRRGETELPTSRPASQPTSLPTTRGAGL